MTNQNIKLAELKKHQYIFGTEILQIPRKILILNCLHIYKWNIPAKKCFNYLNKQRNAVETSYNSSVVCLSADSKLYFHCSGRAYSQSKGGLCPVSCLLQDSCYQTMVKCQIQRFVRNEESSYKMFLSF